MNQMIPNSKQRFLDCLQQQLLMVAPRQAILQFTNDFHRQAFNCQVSDLILGITTKPGRTRRMLIGLLSVVLNPLESAIA